MPPSRETLIRRLRGRGMVEKEIARRLEFDLKALRAAWLFDLVVVNHDNDEQGTADRILAHIYSRHEKLLLHALST